jgi:uncharacterized protein with HEPN domain
MLEAARKAIAFGHGKSRSDLDADEQLALALVRLLEIMGEAARQVEAATRAAHPEIPWREIAGTRDRLIHGYFDVDLDIVWNILTRDLPALVSSLESMLEPKPGGSSRTGTPDSGK